MAKTVAHVLWEMLESAGVKRVYGVVGDALNPTLNALRDFPAIEFIHVRNEEAGTFAANAESFVTGGPVAVCGTSGPGATHLINGLYDALHEGTPTIAIAGDVATSEIGSGMTEEVDTTQAYAACTLWRDRVEVPSQAPAAFRTAIDKALVDRGPVMLSIPGDVASAAYPKHDVPTQPIRMRRPVVCPAPADLTELAGHINAAEKVAIFGGDGCSDAADEVKELARRINAPVGYSWRGKAFLEEDNPNGVGMSGLLGWGGAYDAMHKADLLLMLGTDWPFDDFYPKDVKTVQVDLESGHLGRHAPHLDAGFVGDVGDTVRALLPLIQQKSDSTFLDNTLKKTAKAKKRLNHYVEHGPKITPIRPEYLISTISDLADDDAAFTVDTGTAYIWSARYLEMTSQRSLFGSASWASMANAMPNSMGIQLAQPDRQVVAFCGDGGVSMLMGELITIAERQLPVKLFVLNNGMLDFVNIEFQEAGLRPFGTTLWNPNFAKVAEAMGLTGMRVEDPATMPDQVGAALATPGPVLIDVVVEQHALAVPPHVSPAMGRRFGYSQMRQVLHGDVKDVADNVDKNLGLI
ncbi:MAG: thiamine pyrophosphate-binding protein [Actinomycetia bacterium]|nr:thiamine pyrophosphate-binding protein [Actinomycetes bacterium]